MKDKGKKYRHKTVIRSQNKKSDFLKIAEVNLFIKHKQ